MIWNRTSTTSEPSPKLTMRLGTPCGRPPVAAGLERLSVSAACMPGALACSLQRPVQRQFHCAFVSCSLKTGMSLSKEKTLLRITWLTVTRARACRSSGKGLYHSEEHLYRVRRFRGSGGTALSKACLSSKINGYLGRNAGVNATCQVSIANLGYQLDPT